MTLEILGPLIPVAFEVTRKALSAILNEANNVNKAQENLKQSQHSASDLQKKSCDELAQYILELRSFSLELFDGLDLYKEELDEALDIILLLQGMSETEGTNSVLYTKELDTEDNILDKADPPTKTLTE